jgi:hypothetical protein
MQPERPRPLVFFGETTLSEVTGLFGETTLSEVAGRKTEEIGVKLSIPTTST